MKKLPVVILSLFYADTAFGYITTDMIGECGTTPDTIYAAFEPFEYTCVNGYYLPADTLGCMACPAGATCDGGTFKFNATNPQGVIPASLITQNQAYLCSKEYARLHAKFQINQYTCAPGYYLPAGNNWLTDNDGCTICPENSYCAGGTYTFNATEPQGIVACASGLYAPTGMWESAQCGHILHIGENVLYLRSTKKTPHALHFAVGGNEFFFANATTADVPMHAGTNRRLKIKYNDVVYSIYDDTVSVNE